jgi:hypothetical protein
MYLICNNALYASFMRLLFGWDDKRAIKIAFRLTENLPTTAKKRLRGCLQDINKMVKSEWISQKATKKFWRESQKMNTKSQQP